MYVRLVYPTLDGPKMFPLHAAATLNIPVIFYKQLIN